MNFGDLAKLVDLGDIGDLGKLGYLCDLSHLVYLSVSCSVFPLDKIRFARAVTLLEKVPVILKKCPCQKTPNLPLELYELPVTK